MILNIDQAEARICGGVIRINLYRPPKAGGCLIEHLKIFLNPIGQLATPQEEVMGFHVIRAAIGDQGFFRLAERDLQCSDNVLRDVVLNLEDISEITIVALGPEMSADQPVNKLASD